MKTMKMEKDKRKSRESEITWVGGFSCQISSNGFFSYFFFFFFKPPPARRGMCGEL